ncbi:MAG: hypothetical protein M3Y03_04800 [Verrucomicrobiota bacterium]|nr:hypothetical protein [Verrucomicrobiota bacterium]
MIPSLVPEEIKTLHRVLLRALGLDHFPPGMVEMNAWRDFLFVMKPLAESEGGAFTADDLKAAVALMRKQNKARESNWSLRFSKIMRDPESFRDCVLIARKEARPRPPIEQTSRTVGELRIATETDHALDAAPPISQPIGETMRKFRERMKGGEK